MVGVFTFEVFQSFRRIEKRGTAARDDAFFHSSAGRVERIVPGGGTALLYASKALKNLEGENTDQDRGIEIVRRALQTPIRQIVDNAGEEGSVVVGRLLGQASQSYGYNAQSGQYVDMIKEGIIDPAKVVRTALQDAASIAGLLITTEAMVAEAPQDAKSNTLGGMPDMGMM